MSSGDGRNGDEGGVDPREREELRRLRRESRSPWAPAGLLGSRSREALRSSSGPRPPGVDEATRRRWRTIGLLAVIVLIVAVALRKHSPTCVTQAPLGPTPAGARYWVAAAVAGTPCPTTGRAIYGVSDSAGHQLIGLDGVADPRGGYLGVAATRADPSELGQSQVILEHSTTLSSWRPLGVLVSGGAGTPTLEPVTATGGYLLADERTHGSHTFIQVSYFKSRVALLAAREAASIDLPLRLSTTANGAPTFLSVNWHGDLRRSRLTLGFDYATVAPGGRPGPEREATGVVRDFRSWTATPDTAADRQLDGLGLTGNHGQMRQVIVEGRPWRLYEAQDAADTAAGRQTGWHVVLADVRAGAMFALKLETTRGTYPSSFSRPTARVLPAPGGGRYLVVTLYVGASGGTRPISGEFLYWTPFRQ